MSFQVIVNSKNGIPQNLTNTNLTYQFDFNKKPPHPHGTNKYKLSMSFITEFLKNTWLSNVQFFYVSLQNFASIKSYFIQQSNNNLTIPSSSIIGVCSKDAPMYDATGVYSSQFKNNNELPVFIEDLRNNNTFQVQLVPISRLLITENLLHYYTFNANDTQGNLLMNQSNGAYDLEIQSGVLINGIMDIPFEISDLVAGRITTDITYGDNFTIGGWFNGASISLYSRLFYSAIGNSAQNAIDIYFGGAGGNQLLFFIGNNGVNTTQASIFRIPPNTWCFYAVVVQGTTWKFFMNGNIENYPNKAGVTNKTKNTNYIGRIYNGGNLNGYIDNTFVYNDILTDAQLNEIYNNGRELGTLDYEMILNFEPIE